MIVFYFLLCRFEIMVDMFDVQAQFNGGEPQRLKVLYLGVTLSSVKDQLNEFNQGVNPGDQGGWNTFGINVQRSKRGEYYSVGWN